MRPAKIHSLIMAALALLGGCTDQRSALERVQAGGELVVVTRNGATTYYEGADGNPAGLEYELAKRFADRLGVRLKMVVPGNFPDILPMVANGEVHLAAAGLTATDTRRQRVRFGPTYQRTTQQLIYRLGNPKPASLADIVDGDLEVVAGSSHVERLHELRRDHPDLSWRENAELESEELLTYVWEQLIDYTVADSNEFAINRRFYPELRVAFDLTEPQRLAWAFPRGDDFSLYNEAVRFFGELLDSGELEQLRERFYGHTGNFDYVGTRIFIKHYYERLPRYRPAFEEAANETGLDWRLLAAIGYQESHWNARAVSPTGVRGIMMLTLPTARQLGVKRTDPEQSILGGALYFKRLLDRLPGHITEPDRSWMAVAAYNVGFGHLEDARAITELRGRDPDKWVYVKESLPLLRKKAWYKQTKHGYARGHEPVLYVENIRNYYDQLVRVTESQKLPRSAPPPPPTITNPVL